MLDRNACPCNSIYLIVYWPRRNERPILLDGAMGTELIARGLEVARESADSWNLKRPDEVRAVHASYVAAGADVVLTNTFGLASSRVADADKASVAIAGVELARAAGARRIWGSLGPAGEPRADFARAGDLLAQAGVEAIALETFFDAAELARALEALLALGLPIIASITVSVGDQGLQTPTGTPLARMAKVFDKHRPDAVGVNCSLDAERMAAAVAALAARTDLPVLAKPQAKQSQRCLSPKNLETTSWFTRHALELVRTGATAVGGCCGIGPTFITALRQSVDSVVAWPERSCA